MESNLQDVLRASLQTLTDAGVESPEADIKFMMCAVLDVEPAQIEVQFALNKSITSQQNKQFDAMLVRRAGREPLQHILGRAWFRHLTLEVGSGVFVPRPETELLAGMAIDFLRSLVDPQPIAVDLGTGSGAIALAMATEVPHARVVAIEKSDEAFPWTKRNFESIAAENAQLVHGDLTGADLLTAFPELHGQVAVIVSNPPYIPTNAIPRDIEVQLHDPEIALYGGEDGLDIIREIAQIGRVLGRPGAQLMLEHGELQGQSIRSILSDAGWRAVATHRDLVGRDRYTTATL